jgi:glycosyltransferase involved in cell wall biosynthesis
MAEIGQAGVTHLNATTAEEWVAALTVLLTDGDRRNEMGAAGRRHVVEHYSLVDQAEKLAQALRQAAIIREAA